MHDVFTVANGLMWVTVLIAPPLALVVLFAIQKAWPSIQFSASLLFIALLVLSLILFLLGISFTNVLINIIWLAASYFFYCIFIASTWQLKFKPARYFALIIGSLPICLGYVLGTVGVLGLFFIVGDMVEPPEHTEQMGRGLVCEMTDWGSVGSSSGYSIDLYELWPAVPFLRRRVVHLSVVEAGYVGDQPPADKTCADALNNYEH